MDERSERNIATLKPEVQPLAKRLIEEGVKRGINVKVIGGTRTYEEQNDLYAIGRTKQKNKPVVTKARGGQSLHNFGLAFDVGVFSEDGKTYHGEHPDYETLGPIGESLGLEWGGRWKFVDFPHYQFNPQRLSLAQMRERTESGQDLFT